MFSPTPAWRRRRSLLPLFVVLALLGTGALSPSGNPLTPSAAQAAKKTAKASSKKTVSSSRKTTKKTAKKPKYTLEGELRKLKSSKAISAADYKLWLGIYTDAKVLVARLPKGTKKTELTGVIRNTEQIAERRQLTGSLAPSVFLTLQVNRDWWTSPQQPIPPVGGRPIVPGSPLTWQYYAGEGLQIQWLATFGNANALATTSTPAKIAQLKAIQDEALRLQSVRAGGPAWQYLFDFGGGAPPWGSGMAQVTAMQSLVRTSNKLGDPIYRDTALRAVALLRHSSPSGALLKQPGGDHILLYTFTKTRVMNAFIQAVSGLHEIALTGDTKVSALYVRAERELRIELPQYLTPNWARYSMGGANETPSYHTLSRDLLRGLCKTLTADAQLFASGQPVAGAAARVAGPLLPDRCSLHRGAAGDAQRPQGPWPRDQPQPRAHAGSQPARPGRRRQRPRRRARRQPALGTRPRPADRGRPRSALPAVSPRRSPARPGPTRRAAPAAPRRGCRATPARSPGRQRRPRPAVPVPRP